MAAAGEAEAEGVAISTDPATFVVAVRRFLFLAFLAPLLFPLSAELLRDGRGRRGRLPISLSVARALLVGNPGNNTPG